MVLTWKAIIVMNSRKGDKVKSNDFSFVFHNINNREWTKNNFRNNLAFPKVPHKTKSINQKTPNFKLKHSCILTSVKPNVT